MQIRASIIGLVSFLLLFAIPCIHAQTVEELFSAIQNRDNLHLKRLLELKADPNGEFHPYLPTMTLPPQTSAIRDRNGDLLRYAKPEEMFVTPLKAAVQQENFVAVQLLLDAGADPNKCDVMGGTPLMETSDPKLARLLLDHGANPNAQANPIGLTPLTLAIQRSLELMKLLIERGADVNQSLYNGMTPLIFSLRYSEAPCEKMKWLLKHGANPLTKSKSGGTALMVASSNGLPIECLRILLQLGIEINAQTDIGVTALLNAGSDTEIVKFLLEYGANPNVVTKNGMTPLGQAIENMAVPVVALLLKHGANPDRANGEGIPPLVWAVGRHNLDNLKLLLKAGAQVNVKDSIGTTPLNWACSRGETEMVRLLLAYHADVNLPTRDGRTALQIARTMKHPAVVRLLLKAGAKK